jgi:hypothetical protein
MARVLKLATLVSLALVAAVVHAGGTGRKEGDISAPVVYKELMLVLSNDDGAAAVVFTEAIDRGIKYKFRYESKDGKSSSGEAAVFEKYENGRYAGGDLFIKAGPIQLGWSNGTPVRGFVYYNPDKMKVQIAMAKFFDDSVVKPIVGEPKLIKKIDLKRFMK